VYFPEIISGSGIPFAIVNNGTSVYGGYPIQSVTKVVNTPNDQGRYTPTVTGGGTSLPIVGSAIATTPTNVPVQTVINATNNSSSTPPYTYQPTITGGTPASSSTTVAATPNSAPPQRVTMKSGLGCGMMVSLGKETYFGSISVDLGVALRTFSFYFPSAMPIQSIAAGNLKPAQGFTAFKTGDTATTVAARDDNVYGSYSNRYTQVGFRAGGSVSFKVIENISIGVSAAAEIFGNKTLTMNPNVSSFSYTPNATSSASTKNQRTSAISNTNMMSSAVAVIAKNVVTNVMMTLTYSMPIGN